VLDQTGGDCQAERARDAVAQPMRGLDRTARLNWAQQLNDLRRRDLIDLPPAQRRKHLAHQHIQHVFPCHSRAICSKVAFVDASGGGAASSSSGLR
jgi:hypothetical protein